MEHITKTRHTQALKQKSSRLHAQNAIMNKFRLGGIDTGITYTISELIEAFPDINHRSVRRSVHDLVEQGHLYEVGRGKANAVLYGTSVAVKSTGKPGAIMYVFGGELIDLPTFVMRLLNRQDNAFHFGNTSQSVLADGLEDKIRKLVAVGLLSSDSEHQLHEMFAAKAVLSTLKEELKGLLGLIASFEESSIFKVHQRGMLKDDLKELIKNHPNLYSTLKGLSQ